MHLLRKARAGRDEASRAVSEATEAGTQAGERLARARHARDSAVRIAGLEHKLIADLKTMRERNHIAELIVTSIIRSDLKEGN